MKKKSDSIPFNYKENYSSLSTPAMELDEWRKGMKKFSFSKGPHELADVYNEIFQDFSVESSDRTLVNFHSFADVIGYKLTSKRILIG